MNVKFGAGERTYRAIFHFYRGNMSPLRGEYPFLDHWVKTIPAWLRYAQAYPTGN